MTKSESINELAGALAKAQSEMKGAVKDSSNPFFKSNYADLASVWDSCRGPLTKHGLSVSQVTSLREGHSLVLETVLMHSSGQWLNSEYPINPVKNDPQGLGSALSYARRYSLSALIGAYADDDDGEGSMDRNERTGGHLNAKQGHSTPKPSGPLDYPWEKELASDAQRKKLYAMTKSLDWNPPIAVEFIHRHTGKSDSEQLTKGEIQALFLLLEAEQAKMNKAAPK